MKTIFLLIIVIHLAIGRYTFIDRQFEDGDARQNCTEKCTEECEQCNVPKTCGASELKCGELPPEVHPDCPPDETCVPIGCICKL